MHPRYFNTFAGGLVGLIGVPNAQTNTPEKKLWATPFASKSEQWPLWGTWFFVPFFGDNVFILSLRDNVFILSLNPQFYLREFFHEKLLGEFTIAFIANLDSPLYDFERFSHQSNLFTKTRGLKRSV